MKKKTKKLRVSYEKLYDTATRYFVEYYDGGLFGYNTWFKYDNLNFKTYSEAVEHAKNIKVLEE